MAANDIAIAENGKPVAGIVRFHNALCELVGRHGIRNDISRYEAIGFGLVEMQGEDKNKLREEFPRNDSRLLLSSFFDTLYARYDERFVVGAPNLKSVTLRNEWDSESPGLLLKDIDYRPRIAN